MSVIPIIASAEDVPGAVRHAQRNKDSRWYVARRAEALGVPHHVPAEWGLTADGASREKRKRASTIQGTDSFPIENKADLRKAVRAYGRAGDKAKAKKHILSQARKLGAMDLIPDDWKKGTTASGTPPLPRRQDRSKLRAMTAAGWDTDLHPRDRRGRFIEKLDLIDVFSVEGGTEVQFRGKAIGNGKGPSGDYVDVEHDGGTTRVPVSRIESAPPEKARLDVGKKTSTSHPLGAQVNIPVSAKAVEREQERYDKNEKAALKMKDGPAKEKRLKDLEAHGKRLQGMKDRLAGEEGAPAGDKAPEPSPTLTELGGHKIGDEIAFGDGSTGKVESFSPPGYTDPETGIEHPTGLVWVRDEYENEIGYEPEELNAEEGWTDTPTVDLDENGNEIPTDVTDPPDLTDEQLLGLVNGDDIDREAQADYWELLMDEAGTRGFTTDDNGDFHPSGEIDESTGEPIGGEDPNDLAATEEHLSNREAELTKAREDDEYETTFGETSDPEADQYITVLPPLSRIRSDMVDRYDTDDGLPRDDDGEVDRFQVIEDLDIVVDGDDDQAMTLVIDRIDKAINADFNDGPLPDEDLPETGDSMTVKESGELIKVAQVISPDDDGGVTVQDEDGYMYGLHELQGGEVAEDLGQPPLSPEDQADLDADTAGEPEFEVSETKVAAYGGMNPAHALTIKGDDGEEIGHLWWDKETGEIYSVVVQPEQQRQGHGTSMFREANRLAEENGWKAPEHSDFLTDAGASFVKSFEEAKEPAADDESGFKRGTPDPSALSEMDDAEFASFAATDPGEFADPEAAKSAIDAESARRAGEAEPDFSNFDGSDVGSGTLRTGPEGTTLSTDALEAFQPIRDLIDVDSGSGNWASGMNDIQFERLRNAVDDWHDDPDSVGSWENERLTQVQQFADQHQIEDITDVIDFRREMSELGWSVEEQLHNILDGEAIEEQNPNAVKMISDKLNYSSLLHWDSGAEFGMDGSPTIAELAGDLSLHDEGAYEPPGGPEAPEAEAPTEDLPEGITLEAEGGLEVVRDDGQIIGNVWKTDDGWSANGEPADSRNEAIEILRGQREEAPEAAPAGPAAEESAPEAPTGDPDAAKKLGLMARSAEKASSAVGVDEATARINGALDDASQGRVEKAHKDLAKLMTELKLGGKQRKRYRELLDAHAGTGGDDSAKTEAAAVAEALPDDNPVKEKLAAKAQAAGVGGNADRYAEMSDAELDKTIRELVDGLNANNGMQPAARNGLAQGLKAAQDERLRRKPKTLGGDQPALPPELGLPAPKAQSLMDQYNEGKVQTEPTQLPKGLQAPSAPTAGIVERAEALYNPMTGQTSSKLPPGVTKTKVDPINLTAKSDSYRSSATSASEIKVDGKTVGTVQRGKVGSRIMNGSYSTGWQSESSGWLAFDENGKEVRGGGLTAGTVSEAIALLMVNHDARNHNETTVPPRHHLESFETYKARERRAAANAKSQTPAQSVLDMPEPTSSPEAQQEAVKTEEIDYANTPLYKLRVLAETVSEDGSIGKAVRAEIERRNAEDKKRAASFDPSMSDDELNDALQTEGDRLFKEHKKYGQSSPLTDLIYGEMNRRRRANLMAGGGSPNAINTPAGPVRAGDVILYDEGGINGERHRMLVESVSDDVKNGQAGFDGVYVDYDGNPVKNKWGQEEARWGYADQAGTMVKKAPAGKA